MELLAALRQSVGARVYLPTTIFNAWMVLRLLVEPPTVHRPPVMDVSADAPSRWIRHAYHQQPELVTRAVNTIGENLARFAARCVQAGADGVFLSVRDDWVDTPEEPGLYDRLVRPADEAILAAVRSGSFVSGLAAVSSSGASRGSPRHVAPVRCWELS